MEIDWKRRLLEAIDRDPRKDRAISLAAKLGPNFVGQLRNSNKEPGIEKVLKLAAEVNLSLSELFLGKVISREDEEFLCLLLQAHPELQRSVLTILQRDSAPAKAPSPDAGSAVKHSSKAQ